MQPKGRKNIWAPLHGQYFTSVAERPHIIHLCLTFKSFSLFSVPNIASGKQLIENTIDIRNLLYCAILYLTDINKMYAA